MNRSLSDRGLSDRELATLHARFIVPIAVQMILNDIDPLDDASEEALHQCLTEFQPDTGLLCIALCAQHVAAHVEEAPIAKLLSLAANRMAQEYGVALLAEAENWKERISDDEALDLLEQVPEDLEELSDLLDATMAETDPHSVAGLLCEILSAHAHILTEKAGDKLEELSFLRPHTRPKFDPRKLERLDSNVIVFPR